MEKYLQILQLGRSIDLLNRKLNLDVLQLAFCLLQVLSGEAQQLVFTIPIFEPLPSQYYVRAVSDRWLGSQSSCAISFQHLILPERHPPHTGKRIKYMYYINI